MRFINLTTGFDDYSDDRSDMIYTINPEHIVLMKDRDGYGCYATEVELSNGSVLSVYETIQEILDMITEG